jgi:tetratricopeptide (TPR) repeat protein
MSQARWMVCVGLLALGLLAPTTHSAAAVKLRPYEVPPLATAAEYYLNHRQFDRALELYRQLAEQEKVNPKYWERTATLALYVEGRASAQDTVQKYFSALGPTGVKRNAEHLNEFLNGLNGTFVTDRAQALFLQGKVRSERGDCEGALGFFRQALETDRSLLPVLQQQIVCQMRAESYSQAYEDLKSAYLLNPLSLAVSEPLAEMHLYFGSVAAALDTIHETQKYRALSPRLLVAQSVALARKTDREAAWQALKRIESLPGSLELPAILLWEKANLLETDPHRKSALAKIQLTEWLRQFLSRSKKQKAGFDPYKTTAYVEEAKKWLAALEAPPASN